MTKAELQELLSKPADALTSRDIKQLQHLAKMRELFGPDHQILEPSEVEVHSIYVEITTVDDKVYRRALLGYR